MSLMENHIISCSVQLRPDADSQHKLSDPVKDPALMTVVIYIVQSRTNPQRRRRKHTSKNKEKKENSEPVTLDARDRKTLDFDDVEQLAKLAKRKRQKEEF